MKGLFSRGRCAALLACILLVTRAEAETSLELFAGGTPYVSAPANTVPVSPSALALAPNGTLYLADGASGKILSYDPATSTITSVPNLPGMLEYRYTSVRALGYGPGVLNLADSFEHWQLDLVEGFRSYFGVYGGGIASATFAPDGTLYYSKFSDHEIFKRTTSGTVSTVVGSTTAGFSGDGTTSALFSDPRGVVFDAAGNMYIADSGNNRVRRRAAATGIIATIAGTGATNYNGNNLLATQTNLSSPTGLAIDTAGNLYIYESGGARIRRLNAATGRIVNFAGNGTFGGNPGNGGLAFNASLENVSDMEVTSNGTLYIAEEYGYRVRKVDASGIISQIVGNGTSSFCGEGVPALKACLAAPTGVAIDDAGNVYVADRGNARVRKISAATGLITTIAGGSGYDPDGDGGPALAAHFQYGVGGIAIDAARNLYAIDGNRIRRVDAASGIITTVAGATAFGFAGDGGPATAARFNMPSRLAFDPSGNLFISDSNNNRVRRIDAATGIITTVAGNGLNSSGPLGDGGPATVASVSNPLALAFDPAGNLLIGDTGHFTIRKVNSATGVITTIAGITNVYGHTGNGGPATAAAIGHRPVIAVDAGGNIYLATESFTGELRRIDAQTGIINPAPAPIWGLYTPEGRGFEGPNDMVLGADNRLYMTDRSNAVFRISGVPTPASDMTPPVIEPVITGTLGNNGWYRSNVQISWSVTDPESAVTETYACAQSQVTWDTNGTSLYCRASSSGGTAERRILIKKDTVEPQLTFGTPSPAPDAAGWNSTDVSVPFNATDAMSGVYSTSSGSPVSITGSGSSRSATVVVTDGAGNSSIFTTPAVNIDRSAPVVTANVSGALGSNDWYTSDVAVSWTTTDGDSPVSATEGCDNHSVTTDTSGVTFTCTATSAGGSTTTSVTIKRDATPPQLEFGTLSPLPNAAGWNSGEVNIPFTTTDATSGVATTSHASPLAITGPGGNLSTTVVVNDAAGNSATFTSPAVNIDTSAPVVTPHLSGTLGNNGWYVSDVHLTWTDSDENSPILSREGCFTVTLAADTPGASYSCTVNSVGGSTTETVTFKRDATPPVLSFEPPYPAANSSGWHNGDVIIPFSAADASSGVVSTSGTSPVLINGDGPNLTSQIVVTDGAGNSATFTTPAVNIDRTPPAIAPVVSGTVGNGGWYTSDVQVSWAINESPASIISSNGCGTSIVSADTSGATFTCSVVSGGGTASSSVTVKRDATPPVLSFGTPSPVPNSNGWNKTNVSVPFTRSDALSGLASTSAASPVVISTEGAGVTGQVVVTDLAGNSATFTTVPRNVDKTAPVVAITAPAHGATYGFYQDVIGNYSCTDLSLLSCVGTTASGDPVNTRTAGARTFKVTGKDLALFTTAVTNSFTVESLFNFDGFLSPSNEPPTLNLVARGSLVPIRWQLPDGNGGFVSNPASFTSATVATLTCGSATVVPYNGSTSGPPGIDFDPATNRFTYNWQTSASWTGCRKLTIKLRDNTLHELRFKFQ